MDHNRAHLSEELGHKPRLADRHDGLVGVDVVDRLRPKRNGPGHQGQVIRAITNDGSSATWTRAGGGARPKRWISTA